MKMITKEIIRKLADKYYADTVKIRRHLHQNPELSYQEIKTSEFIQENLNLLGIAYKTDYVKTGIVGCLEGQNPDKKSIALRADMDALPIFEENRENFISKNKGIMHACGHDVHMASLLGTARILSELKNDFEGRILFIFQPAEEKIPGGAKGMIAEGALAEYKPDVILAQHVMPELKSGTAGFKSGVYMASTDEIYLTVKGQGGHAAMPDRFTDTVLIASHIIVALQQVVSRFAPVLVPSVLSFGKVEANGANNIIPAEVKIAGTFRTMNAEWRKKAHRKIQEICESVAQGMGGECLVDIQPGYPMVENDEITTLKAIQYAGEYLGKENIIKLEPQMTAEDFAYFAQLAPATLFRLGTDDHTGKYSSPLHSSEFGIDENAIKTGMELLSWLAISFLNETTYEHMYTYNLVQE